jgi:hypothetical protein
VDAAAGSGYYYAVSAVDADGDESVKSELVSLGAAAGKSGGHAVVACFIETAAGWVARDGMKVAVIIGIFLILAVIGAQCLEKRLGLSNSRAED